MALVTLLSDLGTADTALSKTKALLRANINDIEIIDIAHRISPYDIQQAAYLCLSAYHHFPAATTHLLLVNLFYGERPRMLLAQKDGFFFIVPDNGLLSLAFAGDIEKVWLCAEFNESCTFQQWLNQAIKVIVTVSENIGDLHQHFMPFIISETPKLLPPKPIVGGVDCNVLYIDRYGNVVVNITSAEFREILREQPFNIRLSREVEITRLSRHYNEVEKGKPLCRFNSNGFLEIAVNHGSAAGQFELLPILARNISYQGITINFG